MEEKKKEITDAVQKIADERIINILYAYVMNLIKYNKPQEVPMVLLGAFFISLKLNQSIFQGYPNHFHQG